MKYTFIDLCFELCVSETSIRGALKEQPHLVEHFREGTTKFLVFKDGLKGVEKLRCLINQRQSRKYLMLSEGTYNKKLKKPREDNSMEVLPIKLFNTPSVQLMIDVLDRKLCIL